MPRLSEIITDEAYVDFEIAGVIVHLGYRPNVVTMSMLAKLEILTSRDELDTEAAVGEMAELLCQLIGSWDLTDDDDELLPISAETFATLPWKLIELTMRAIQQDSSLQTSDAEGELEKKESSGTSEGGSFQPVNKGNVRNGTPTSRRPKHATRSRG